MEVDNKTTPLEKEIGAIIGKTRDNNGESQSELAEAIGVSREIVNHWERGSRHIKADNLVALAKHFNVTTDYLLGRTKIKTPTVEMQAISDHTGLSADAIEILHMIKESGSNQSELLNEIIVNEGFVFSLVYLEMACTLQSAFRDEASKDVKAVNDALAYRSIVKERFGAVELAPSDSIKFYRQEAIDGFATAIKDIIERSKGGVNNG